MSATKLRRVRLRDVTRGLAGWAHGVPIDLPAAGASWQAEIERLRAELADRTEACARLADTRAELQRLLAEALDLLAEDLPSQIRRELGPGSDNDQMQRSGPVAWNIACWIQDDIAGPFVDRIRREAGLA